MKLSFDRDDGLLLVYGVNSKLEKLKLVLTNMMKLAASLTLKEGKLIS